MPNVTVTSFVGADGFSVDLGVMTDFAGPVRALMGKTVQTTASSAADRGHCQSFFFTAAPV